MRGDSLRRRRTGVAVVALFLLAGAGRVAGAQLQSTPCIACKHCWTTKCFRTCRSECPQPAAVSGAGCRSLGAAYGPEAAQAACTAAKRFCIGGAPIETDEGGRSNPAELDRCATTALAACRKAADAGGLSHPCAPELASGLGRCSASDFRAAFDGEARDQCTSLAARVTAPVGDSTGGGGDWASAWRRPRQVLRPAWGSSRVPIELQSLDAPSSAQPDRARGGRGAGVAAAAAVPPKATQQSLTGGPVAAAAGPASQRSRGGASGGRRLVEV